MYDTSTVLSATVNLFMSDYIAKISDVLNALLHVSQVTGVWYCICVYVDGPLV